MANKVQFNLKNVFYAILHTVTGQSGTSYTWDTPVHVPGAVSLSLEAQGDSTPFYADGVVYYQSVANNGYEGDLEMAKITDAMLKDVWKFAEGSTSKVLTENASEEPNAFALLFQIDGDAGNEFYVFYNCTATRPAVGSQTNSESKEPQTQSCTITAVPLESGKVFARTTANTPSTVKDAWFDAVFVDSATNFTVSYNANGGTGSVLDGNSPYASGSTVTVLAATGLTAPSGKTFDEWNTAQDGSGQGYAASATFTISANTILYAQWE